MISNQLSNFLLKSVMVLNCGGQKHCGLWIAFSIYTDNENIHDSTRQSQVIFRWDINLRASEQISA